MGFQRGEWRSFTEKLIGLGRKQKKTWPGAGGARGCSVHTGEPQPDVPCPRAVPRSDLSVSTSSQDLGCLYRMRYNEMKSI